ncbi:DUF456 domain-containing protein [Paenibacillus sp. J2TS4]|uniref:DUF456 domain-containing protein n=1 Tax=Paenibacillus sp. J2TS4 TaxID=2807194 RepID=UPI001B2DA387|nr:DUF456 family protein [Paenibacillus sp. J2TS4]GIP31161.1 hypothetical protein J2TS4_03710 [Paenibacillus sp. J2TS4]
MAILGWILIVALFVVGMLGTVFPVLPGVLAVYAAFFVYGLFFSFEPFGFWFWAIQTAIVIALLVADYMISALGVKKFGGTKASVIGSTIGIMIGPFVIPFAGLILGPFLGAVIGELVVGANWKQAGKAGIGSVVGFFSSVIVKILLQLLMIFLFILWLLV